MATLIPALGSCVARMTQGERRTAERLEDKLDADYLVWYDVPVGPKQAHPDFVVLHPRRGLLVLEVKDWRLETVRSASRATWEILAHGVPKTVPSPFEQARHYAHQVVDALKRDPRLLREDGQLAFPWSYGVVLTHVTRRQFTQAELHHAIEPHRVVCSDEMTAATEAEDFQSRLWDMFPHLMRGTLTLPQIDRVRWILFPEVRVNPQLGLFSPGGAAATGAGHGAGAAADPDAEPALPDIMRVMDLQQEQLARSLGSGHRVIHGVAGSGKTMILACRAEYLARAARRTAAGGGDGVAEGGSDAGGDPGGDAPADGGAATPSAAKPILVLCYNAPLAQKLDALMAAKGLAAQVHVRNFHKWCRQQLVAFGQGLPPEGPDFFDALVQRVIRGVDRGQIPAGQYQAVLIDEGHDFAPAWLKLAAQMVDPRTDSLLVLYDDAQSIYRRHRTRAFSFRSVGIQAQGRTTILKINYRNTRQILQLASRVAADLLAPGDATADASEDAVPLVQPVSCGREGPEPLVIRLPGAREEALKIAELLCAAHEEGHAWGDMAVLGRHHAELERCAAVLRHRRVPHALRTGPGGFDPLADSVKLLTMHASKGLEFPLVALAGAGRMPAAGQDAAEEARLFYVAATRATLRLIVPLAGCGAFAARLLPDSAATAPA